MPYLIWGLKAMTKKELQEKTEQLKAETKSALELLYNGLNQGH